MLLAPVSIQREEERKPIRHIFMGFRSLRVNYAITLQTVMDLRDNVLSQQKI